MGPEEERGALLEIATAMSLLNAGADLLVMYHPAGGANGEAEDRRDDALREAEETGQWH